MFFYLSKAIDSLPHSLVLASLAKVGVCGTLYSWFQSYLSGRQQRVVLNGVSSQPARVTSGVPQGSILGPLLFLLSINSIFDVSLSYNALINVYADDILLYKEIMSDLDLIAFQSDVSLIVEWVRTTNLHLNSSKTKSLLISRKRRPPDLRLHVDEVPVECVPWFRYLGVTISEVLRWRRHIDEVCCRARRQLGFLYRCLVLVICPASPTCTRCLSYQYFATALVSGTLFRRGYVTNWNVSRDLLAWRQEVGRKIGLPCAQGWDGVSFPRGGKARS